MGLVEYEMYLCQHLPPHFYHRYVSLRCTPLHILFGMEAEATEAEATDKQFKYFHGAIRAIADVTFHVSVTARRSRIQSPR